MVGNEGAGNGGWSLASAGGGVRVRVRAWERVGPGLEFGIPLSDRLDPLERKRPRISFTPGSRL